MGKKENIIRMNPQFIRLRDGSLMNINNIVAISEADSKVFVLGYQRIPITEEDMAAVLENIEIIDDDEHQHHCGQDAGECKVSCGNLEATVSCKNLLGMQVVSIGGSENERPAEEGVSLQDIMAQIKKGTDAFMNYLESIVKTQER